MKRTLTLTFEFDDGPWIDRDTGKKYPTDAIAYAMDQVNDTLPRVCVDFVDAKLDGEILVDGAGYVSEDVQKHEAQHRAFLKEFRHHQEVMKECASCQIS